MSWRLPDEALARHRPVHENELVRPARAQPGDDGGGFPMPGRQRDTAALTTRRPAITAGHAGGGSGLVQEHQPVRVQVELTGKPRLAGRPYVLPLLLSRVDRPFLRLMR